MRIRIQFPAILALAVGALLGWLTASGRLTTRLEAQDKSPQPAVKSVAKPAVEKLDRATLPIPEPKVPHSTVFDARKATPPPRFQVKSPAGAPNVLIVLIDDMVLRKSG